MLSRGLRLSAVRPYPEWLEFHSRAIDGPVASVRSRSGIVRLEVGEGAIADRVLLGIPDDDAWTAFAETLDAVGFWDWPAETAHREPHRPGDSYWWLEVREEGREHRAAAWNDAPAGLDDVQAALFELVKQLVDEPAYVSAPAPGRALRGKQRPE